MRLIHPNCSTNIHLMPRTRAPSSVKPSWIATYPTEHPPRNYSGPADVQEGVILAHKPPQQGSKFLKVKDHVLSPLSSHI